MDTNLIGLLYFFQYLLRVWETIFFFLGKNQFIVGHDFKNASAGFDQSCFHSHIFLNSLCQTGSLGMVVSFIAVFNGNVFCHALLLSWEFFSSA